MVAVVVVVEVEVARNIKEEEEIDGFINVNIIFCNNATVVVNLSVLCSTWHEFFQHSGLLQY